MATIRERGPYQWQAQIIRKGQSSQYKTFNNKADAEKWARQVEAEMDRGGFISRKEAENTTLSEALDRYENEVGVKKKGYWQEKYKIDFWRKSLFGKRYLVALRPADLASWRDQYLKEHSPSTVNRPFPLQAKNAYPWPLRFEDAESVGPDSKALPFPIP